MDVFFSLLVLVLIAGGFYGAGYVIARRWRKSTGITVLYSALIGLGLFCLCAGLLFGACLCALGNGKL